MDNIIKLSDEFDFSQINLEHPTGLQGGTYFTRIKRGFDPLYIQPNRCKLKAGLVKTQKKAYIDLMFSFNDEHTINWFEELEKSCIDNIYKKRDLWFHNELEHDDIENKFTAPIRTYKSGKYYLIRCYLPNITINEGLLKCYDENLNPLPIDLQNSCNDGFSKSIVSCHEHEIVFSYNSKPQIVKN